MWQKELSEFDPVFVNDGHPASPITTGQRVRTIVRNWRTLTFETPFVNRPRQGKRHPHAAWLSSSCGRTCLRVLENRRGSGRIEVSVNSLPITFRTTTMGNTEI